MIRGIALLVLASSLAACAGHPPLAEPSGPYRPLNVGHWTPTADDLHGPRPPIAPAMFAGSVIGAKSGECPMKLMTRNVSAPSDAFVARPITADPALLQAYFAQVASYEADRLRGAERSARVGFAVGAVGAVIGLLGVAAVAGLTPLKTVVPLVFRVDQSTGAVERVYDLRGGTMTATEAEKRFFLWQYVRLRQTYTAPEAQANFNAVLLMSSPQVQNEYAASFKGTNPNSPQVVLGQDGSATVREVSTSFLGPKLAQIRFVQHETKAGNTLPDTHMVATIAFEQVSGQLSASAINVNPLEFIVTSYRADVEAPQ